MNDAAETGPGVPDTTQGPSDIEARVLDWFATTWDPEMSLIEWRTRLVDSGWAVPSWSPDWFGLGLAASADPVAHAAIRRAGVVAVPLGVGMMLAAPTLYEHGSDELRRRLLRPTLTGQAVWCQLFSEPGAGSDLAGLATTAVRDGDEWVVSGQKVWNTSADHADHGLLLARTDWGATKHAGLSYFVLDMDQPGVEVRPIRQMNNRSSFNEVFLTEARIPVTDLVGAEGDGWRVARATLAHERSYGGLRSVPIDRAATGRVIHEARAEADDYNRTYEWYPQRMGRVDLVVDQARRTGRAQDPVVRQEMMKLLSLHRASEWTAARAKAGRELGRPPGPEGSIGKLALSEVARRANQVHTLIAGADAMLSDGGCGDAGTHRMVAEVLVSTPAQSIAGGTDEIQRTILGENVLGLPREPAVDRDVPYRNVAR